MARIPTLPRPWRGSAGRLLETIEHGLWRPKSNSAAARLAQLAQEAPR